MIGGEVRGLEDLAQFAGVFDALTIERIDAEAGERDVTPG